MANNDKNAARARRRTSIRRKVRGEASRPRLTVFRSNKHIYAQVVDDSAGVSLAAASSASKALADELQKCGSKVERAQVVGNALAKACLEKGIKSVVFDRNGYQYRGAGEGEEATTKPTRVAALAEAARGAGLEF